MTLLTITQKGGKKEKDMTADMTPEQIYEELARNGIVKKVASKKNLVLAVNDVLGAEDSAD